MGRNGKKIRLIIPGSITNLMIPMARPQRDDHIVKEESNKKTRNRLGNEILQQYFVSVIILTANLSTYFSS